MKRLQLLQRLLLGLPRLAGFLAALLRAVAFLRLLQGLLGILHVALGQRLHLGEVLRPLAEGLLRERGVAKGFADDFLPLLRDAVQLRAVLRLGIGLFTGLFRGLVGLELVLAQAHQLACGGGDALLLAGDFLHLREQRVELLPHHLGVFREADDVDAMHGGLGRIAVGQEVGRQSAHRDGGVSREAQHGGAEEEGVGEAALSGRDGHLAHGLEGRGVGGVRRVQHLGVEGRLAHAEVVERGELHREHVGFEDGDF